MKPPSVIRLTSGKRVLFLTKDPELVRKQLRGELDLQMKNLRVEDLLDDINTDAFPTTKSQKATKPSRSSSSKKADCFLSRKRSSEARSSCRFRTRQNVR